MSALRSWALRSTSWRLPLYWYILLALALIGMVRAVRWRARGVFDGAFVGFLIGMSGMWLQGQILRAVIDEQVAESTRVPSTRIPTSRVVPLWAQGTLIAFAIAGFLLYRAGDLFAWK
jgi:hypothetical protein